MADKALLEVVDVTKHYGGLAALQKVSFSMREGVIMGFIGPNGAGKTTLFDHHDWLYLGNCWRDSV